MTAKLLLKDSCYVRIGEDGESAMVYLVVGDHCEIKAILARVIHEPPPKPRAKSHQPAPLMPALPASGAPPIAEGEPP